MKYYSKNLTNMYFSFITMLYSLIEIMNNVVINNVSTNNAPSVWKRWMIMMNVR